MLVKSFIEQQFPVSKVSKESYKERKAGASQTLPGLGKWWGRKPLFVVRAAILGCLMPSSDNPERDMAIFQKILSMDTEGLQLRKEKSISAAELYRVVSSNKKLKKYLPFFDLSKEKPKLKKEAPKKEIERAVYDTYGYDEKLVYCKRPENLDNISENAWNDINLHLGTNAHSLPDLVEQLSVKRYGKTITVGDCFCGGGSIPFEAARIGCNTYGSDLNPVASLLTWADIHVCGASKEKLEEIKAFQRKVFFAADKEIRKLEIEASENGDRAFAYIYCEEVICPECGVRVPLLPTRIIGKGTKTIVNLIPNGNHYSFDVQSHVSDKEMKEANSGTVGKLGLICPHCRKTTPFSTIRHDVMDQNGNTLYGLRRWEQNEFLARENDVFRERLYAIKYEHIETLSNGKEVVKRYYRAPNENDLENERKVNDYVSSHLAEWLAAGLVPSMAIEPGDKTEEVIRNRGWSFWHQLFNARQILYLVKLLEKTIEFASNKEELVSSLLGINNCLNYNSKLCVWLNSADTEHGKNTFLNQALNTLYNYSTRAFLDLEAPFFITPDRSYEISSNADINLKDARDIDNNLELWITDPPYADAIVYHELSEFFLAWDKTLINTAFPDWYTDSKRVLAVRGDENFSQTMIDIYSNLTRHMSDDGMQIVMFTHSDPSVWAQLALIMWKSGLTVTAAWNIATETDASGLKDGNYVKGTVLLVLRKQQGDEEAFLDELAADIKQEVKDQIESMQKLDDKDDPNFSDPDYVLAAYAASLKVLTGYKAIGEIDLDYELDLAIHNPAESEVVKLIERAKKIAYDFIIPLDFENYLWKELSPAERFYIKGLEAEKHGNYQISTYQEYARGFGLGSYNQMMANERANTARLKTPVEFAMRTVREVPDFEESILRLVLQAIHIAIKENENPEKGLWHLKNNVNDYWNSRDMLKQLLSFLKDTKDIDTMPHWAESGQMAEYIYVLVDNDHV